MTPAKPSEAIRWTEESVGYSELEVAFTRAIHRAVLLALDGATPIDP